jgi:hypothetical protein
MRAESLDFEESPEKRGAKRSSVAGPSGIHSSTACSTNFFNAPAGKSVRSSIGSNYQPSRPVSSGFTHVRVKSGVPNIRASSEYNVKNSLNMSSNVNGKQQYPLLNPRAIT